MKNILQKIIKLSSIIDNLGYHQESDDLLKLAYSTEGQANSSEMQEITDPSKASFEHEGLFKKILQSPISFISRITKPEVAIDVFLNGADMEDVVARSSMELNILAQRMKQYSDELGLNRLKQLGPQEILKMMNEPKIEAIYFANEEAREHERRHQTGQEMSPEQLEQQIMQNLGSALPAGMDPEQKKAIVSSWTQNYISNLKNYYGEEEISGELGADAPFIMQKAKEQIPQAINQ